MYTEKEHKKLFKRFFGETATLKYNEYKDEYDMCNDVFYFCSMIGHVVSVPYSFKPYTEMIEYLYGKDIWVFDDKSNIKHIINVPSSYEEMSIICDLMGK